MQIYKEVTPVGRKWLTGCLVIKNGDKCFYVDAGKQIVSLRSDTFEKSKPDLEEITEAQAVEMIPAISTFIANPEQRTPIRLD